MKTAYLLVLVLVAVVVVFLTYTTVNQAESAMDKELEGLGSDIDSVGALIDDFSSLDDLGLSEINDSLFNQ